jgi:MtN3 and saliva related transmembrane protein
LSFANQHLTKAVRSRVEATTTSCKYIIIMILFDVTESFLGYVGGLLMGVAFIPQVWKAWKTKSTKDISYGWQILYLVGCILNYAYLIMVHATAAWIMATIEIFLSILLLIMKINFDGFPGFSDTESEEEKIVPLKVMTNLTVHYGATLAESDLPMEVTEINSLLIATGS